MLVHWSLQYTHSCVKEKDQAKHRLVYFFISDLLRLPAQLLLGRRHRRCFVKVAERFHSTPARPWQVKTRAAHSQSHAVRFGVGVQDQHLSLLSRLRLFFLNLV
jgi:hypothetical protein